VPSPTTIDPQLQCQPVEVLADLQCYPVVGVSRHRVSVGAGPGMQFVLEDDGLGQWPLVRADLAQVNFPQLHGSQFMITAVHGIPRGWTIFRIVRAGKSKDGGSVSIGTT